ncbi:hypothetical protein [uncultured Stenotrophomonas sp.]|uniref:hypothetical protein n=1 Tax=uncultured Stenotrophomonas sp. TaxID=165438 RepID=UPI0025DCBA22|nr:hypothetical protein [uncultured Stenotrophomonas sp.]
MYRQTNDPSVLICLETGAMIPRGHREWPEEWLRSHSPLPPATPYELHSPQHYQAIRSAAWDWMTAWIRDRRYDSIETCVGYFNSGVPRYRDEARAMVAWRDAVNQELEALVLAAPAGIETWDQVRALLPQPEAFNWPGEVSLPLGTGESAVLA